MLNDPIIEELHRIRARMWEECGGDFEKLMDRLTAAEAKHADRLISPEQFRKLKEESAGTPQETSRK